MKIGHVRYFHFPYPDAISQFDVPAGIDDLYNRSETDYRSVVFQTEAALNSGWGAHFGGELRGLDDPSPEGRILETYGFYRSDFGRGWHLEGRGGLLAPRTLPVGRNATAGGAVYLGKQIGEFNVGFLYENKRDDGEYSGIMVQFRPGPVTRALGKYTVDYSRRPEGFTAQIPLWHGRLNGKPLCPPERYFSWRSAGRPNPNRFPARLSAQSVRASAGVVGRNDEPETALRRHGGTLVFAGRSAGQPSSDSRRLVGARPHGAGAVRSARYLPLLSPETAPK